jgi:glycosyltransferase involved in cell wall biosynthesis
MDSRVALLISPYFPPSNVAGVQRTRVLATGLPDFGWEPIVVCVNPTFYEEALDEQSLALIPKTLRLERVSAWPASICRPLGFGDVSLRAQSTMRQKTAELVQKEKIDLVFATVLPGYASLVGAWVKRKFGLPFVLDYQDPWVSNSGAKQSLFSKRGIANRLAKKLEPDVVAAADALTAVSDETLNSLRDRRLLRKKLPVEIIPIGADENDVAVAARKGNSLITRQPGECVLAYLGTITGRMLPAVKALFRAMKKASESHNRTRARLYFVGASGQPDGEDVHNLTDLARKYEISDRFMLHPRRIGYLDALCTMRDADALLLIGSTDSHYTASKLFPCWLSERPIVALFHARSTVIDIARELGGIRVITYDDSNGPEAVLDDVTAALSELVQYGVTAVPQRNKSAFEAYSAQAIARHYAALFDRVVEMTK